MADFHTFYRASWALQERVLASGLAHEVHIVLFHPRAVHSLFEEASAADTKCYALRSPHPTVHFLREKDVMAGITGGYPQPERIPGRNAARLARLGSARQAWEVALGMDGAGHG